MPTKKETKEKSVAVKKTAAAKTVKASTRGSKTVKKEKVEKAAKKESVVVLNPTELAIKTIVEAMQEKKAKNICTLDLTKIGTSICDHFIICNADSTTNVLAIADNIEEQMLVKCKTKVIRQQGKENAFWIIMDYSDIVVHIFQTEYREFYRLEDLWADAVKKTYQED